MRLRRKYYRGYKVEIDQGTLYLWKGLSIAYSDHSNRPVVEKARMAKEWVDQLHEARGVFK